MNFAERFQARLSKIQSLLTVGLDPDIERIPSDFGRDSTALFNFCQKIIDCTYQFVLGYKINIAFFERFGSRGLKEFEKTVSYLQKNYPDVLLIADVKRGELANTSKEYAHYYFKQLEVDSVTLNPYMGLDSLLPFIEYKDKFVFVLCLTSNPDSANFQKQTIQNKFLYEKVATTFTKYSSNIGLVVGGTHLEQLGQMRKKYPNTLFLIPGIGFQGASIEDVIRICGKNSLLSMSRSILFPEDTVDYFCSVEKMAEKSHHKAKIQSLDN